ncbi:MAG: GNAT family N-acetyltransferase [Mesorhizobium sp.]|nr:GNAT family N-acetyltransferase [Mesorhizobium sp.]MBL8580080.1 GNAT family N-acetyltransferase [Mesorhizobium sp.]
MSSIDQTSFRLDVDVRIEPAFDFLSDEYRAFYRPDRATAFQGPLWMDMVHRRLAPNLGAQQRTLTVRNRGDASLVVVIPFVLQRSRGIRILSPADFGVCDYNSIVGDRSVLAAIAANPFLVRRIEAELKGCDIVMFRKVRDDDFDVGLLLRKSASSPSDNAAYQAEIGDDFEEWQRRTIKRKFSKELGRLQRQTDREFGGYEHRLAASADEVRDAFDMLRTWRSSRFEGDLLNNPVYFDFYRDYAIAGLDSGEAATYVSYAGGQPVALLFGPTGDGEFHAVLIGADVERLGKQSPGIQLIYQVIKQRFFQGHTSFDMGLGNTGYKTHFRVEETQLRNHTKTFSVAGYAVAQIYHRAKPVKNFLRTYAPNVR